MGRTVIAAINQTSEREREEEVASIAPPQQQPTYSPFQHQSGQFQQQG